MAAVAGHSVRLAPKLAPGPLGGASRRARDRSTHTHRLSMARGSSLSREPPLQQSSAAKSRSPEGAVVSAAEAEAQHPSSRLSHAGPGERGRERPGAQLTAGQPRRCRRTGSAKPRAPRWTLQPPAPPGHSAPWTPRPATATGLRRPHRARAAGNARQRGLGVAGPRAPCAARLRPVARP